MNNVILRRIDVTGDWQPLSVVRLVGTVTISTPPDNGGAVLFRTTDEPAHEVPWVAGEWHTFHRVDLAGIEVKGSVGDVISVVGGTW
jgi:hypothetical protein